MPRGVTRLHRVFVSVPDSRKPSQPGHPLYLPAQAAGRIDDPKGEYRVWYCAEDWRVSVCEKFRDYSVWEAAILQAPPNMPEGSVMAMATLTGQFSLCDMDNLSTLGSLDLRPSRVVTPDRSQTQAWARKIYAGMPGNVYDGATWWCHWNSDHSAAGVWDLSNVDEVEIDVLTVDHLREAAPLINRMVQG